MAGDMRRRPSGMARGGRARGGSRPQGRSRSIRHESPSGPKPPRTDALAFIESVVAVEHRSYPGAGVFVTSLCGVAAPDGMFWELTIDGERATRGIADLDIEADMHIRWELVPIR